MRESKLIFFTYNFPYGDGETFISNELNYLSETFSKIYIIPLFYGNKKTPREVPGNIVFSEPLLTFDIKKNKLKLLFFGIFNFSPFLFSVSEFLSGEVYKKRRWMKNWLGSTLIIRIILKKITANIFYNKIHDRSLFYFYWGDKSSGIIPFIKKQKSNPIVVRFHNSDLYEEIKGGYIPFRKELLKNIDHAVFISEEGKEYLLKKYSSINFKSRVFRLGVKANRISKCSSDNIVRIISCSYVVPIKRVQLILEALSQLKHQIIWTHFGDGPLLNDLKNMTKSLKNNITVNFLGHLSNKEVLNYYCNNPIDLFINVSESEGIPVSIMEAISCGIPIIATNVGGTSEIVTDKFGIMLPKNISASELSRTIDEFISKSVEDKNKMKLNAFSHWKKNFNADTNYQEFAKFLFTLLPQLKNNPEEN